MAQPDDRIKKIRRNNWIVLAVLTIFRYRGVSLELLAYWSRGKAWARWNRNLPSRRWV